MTKRGQVLVALLCALLGFAVVVQVQQNRASSITSLRQTDLIRLLADLTATSDRLDAEARTLEQTQAKLRSGADGGAAAEQAARQRLAVLGVLAGTVAAHGPGITVSIADPSGQVGATGLLDLIEELRDAGAEAIQVGGVRVVAESAVVDGTGGVQVDGVLVPAPYQVLAIGNKQDLDTALKIPGGVVDAMAAKNATAKITEQDVVTVDALHKPKTPQYARPAPSTSP